jgi:hypothetical protein
VDRKVKGNSNDLVKSLERLASSIKKAKWITDVLYCSTLLMPFILELWQKEVYQRYGWTHCRRLIEEKMDSFAVSGIVKLLPEHRKMVIKGTLRFFQSMEKSSSKNKGRK